MLDTSLEGLVNWPKSEWENNLFLWEWADFWDGLYYSLWFLFPVHPALMLLYSLPTLFYSFLCSFYIQAPVSWVPSTLS